MKLTYKEYLSVAFLLGVVGLLGLLWQKPWQTYGSVEVGNDYIATSTRNSNGVALTNLSLLKSGGGAFARITVGGTNGAVIRFWDATTTNVNLRTGNVASTSLLIAELGTNATGTLDYDADLKYGLIYELVSGTTPTSTILYR